MSAHGGGGHGRGPGGKVFRRSWDVPTVKIAGDDAGQGIIDAANAAGPAVHVCGAVDGKGLRARCQVPEQPAAGAAESLHCGVRGCPQADGRALGFERQQEIKRGVGEVLCRVQQNVGRHCFRRERPAVPGFRAVAGDYRSCVGEDRGCVDTAENGDRKEAFVVLQDASQGLPFLQASPFAQPFQLIRFHAVAHNGVQCIAHLPAKTGGVTELFTETRRPLGAGNPPGFVAFENRGQQVFLVCTGNEVKRPAVYSRRMR